MDQPAQHLTSDAIIDYLSSTELFGTLDKEVLRNVESELERVYIHGGEILIRQGEPGESVYLVVNGRLRASIEQEGGEQIVVGEIGRGESVGEMAILTEERRSATVYVVRDTELVRFSKNGFNHLLEKYPLAIMQIARIIIARLRRTMSTSGVANTVSTIAVVPAGKNVPLSDFVARLEDALSEYGSTLHLSAGRLDGYLGKGASQTSQNDAENGRIVAWLNDQEVDYGFVIYESDTVPSPWTNRCIRQADRVLIVGQADQEPAPGEIERQDDGSTTVRKELVLLHQSNAQQPAGTQQWLAQRDVSAHHHIRLQEQANFERLARFLTGRAVGLALSGGAARGFAHIGVIRAFKENGIPIDAIGGTSMGAVVGAQHAMGMDYNDMLEANRKGWFEFKPFADYTFPMVALTTGRKFNKMLNMIYGDTQIEDLWLKYFCVSSNLTRASTMVHQEGTLWKGIRQSVSVPGAVPPVFYKGDLYVDGCVLNNLPTDVMKQVCEGFVIASDTSVNVEMETDSPDREDLSSWPLLIRRMNPFAEAESIPSILNIMMRSAEVGNVLHTQTLRQQANLFLRPPIEQFERFDWDAVDKIAGAGYEYTIGQIEAWRKAGALSALV